MESGNGVSSSTGALTPVSEISDVFNNNILAPLQSSYLFEESKQSFRYKSAFLIKNPALEEKYNAFRAKRKEVGYSEEDLKETYGFLLFDDLSKANAVGEAGVRTGNRTCSTLGDPSKGVYLSMYSDCLDLNRWYHGKSGYIAVIRLTQGRVKKVLENYTQNLTAPTEGFDCHVSEQLPSVSSNTSSFLAFERTQYYMYELLDNGSNKTAESPSLVCPFAVVAFSYTDTKATPETAQEKSEEKNVVFPYLAWMGQLQLGTQFYSVGLRSTVGSLIRAKLPPVVTVERAISMLDLRQLLPRAVFETSFSGEVFLDGLYCSLCELSTSVGEENLPLSLLLQELKEKDLALTIPLNDGGFLILLHPSHFLIYDNDTGPNSKKVLQGMFVFPDSQVIQRDTKFGQKKLAIPSDIQRVLPLLTYAEGEFEKTPTNSSEERNKIILQYMQSYAALINPGLALSPFREVSIFPDQYDVPDAHKHLYTSPEWTDRSWQSFRSYLGIPGSFQLPLSTASEILAAGQEERREDLDDDVYICLSSPEEALANFVSTTSEDQLMDHRSPANIETSPADAETSPADAETSPADAVSADAETSPAEAATSPAEAAASPAEAEASPAEAETSPAEAETSPAEAETSPAEAETSPAEAETSPAEAETSPDSCRTSAETQIDFTAVPQNVVPNDLQDGEGIINYEKSDVVRTETGKLGLKTVLIPPMSDDLPAELIVSITSAAQTVTNKDLTVISTAAATKPNDGQLSLSSTDKLQMVGLNSLNDEIVKTKQTVECTEAENPTKPHWRKRKGYPRGRKKESKSCTETSRLQSIKVLLVKQDIGSLQRGKCRFGKLASKKEAAEKKQPDPGKQMLESTVLMELEAYSLRKKTERWDLKPVITECGRILVPHGSLDFTDEIKSLKEKLQSIKDEQCPEKMLDNAPDSTIEMGQESSSVLETKLDETKATESKGGRNHPQNIVASHDTSILRQSDVDSSSLTLNSDSSDQASKNNWTDNISSDAVQENFVPTLSSVKCASKGEIMLRKLKSVLLKGKRKGDLRSEEPNAGAASDPELCPKRIKSDLDAEMLKSNDAVTCVQETNVCVQEVTKMLSVDLLFAQALGLTPKETPDKLKKMVDHNAQQTKDLPKMQEQTIADKEPQIILQPPSIFPRRKRIKMLKNHQGIPTEHIRRKWWLHFQTPACFDSEKYKECTRDISVRKTVKERMRAACSSTDALNLLADLALSANKDQVPPQPAQALARKPESSLKKCDLTNDVTSPVQESFLHALLRQPAARPVQPLEPPSPSPLVGGNELVDLVSKEHAYSLPPSSSLLLGLPGTPFQVSPLSGSTRLLLHPQQMYGDGTPTLQPSVDLEDRIEHDHRTPGWLKKHTVRRRKFRHSRTFVNKDRTVQVTRQWDENYDFNLDSKFTVESMDKAINRALHGPWDFSVCDSTEEVRLIVHMWIGLFYSRSTARFFHLDPDFTFPEDSACSEMSSEKMSDPVHSEPVSNGPLPSVTGTSDSQALDLSKNNNSVLDKGSVILDLSLRTPNAEEPPMQKLPLDPKTNSKQMPLFDEHKGVCETWSTLRPTLGLHESSPFQCYRNMVHSTGIVRKVNDSRSIHANQRTCVASQKDDCLERTDKPSSENEKTFISVCGGKENVCIQLANVQTASRIIHMLHGSYNEKTDVNDDTENSDTTEMCLVHKPGLDLSKIETDKEVKCNNDPRNEFHSDGHDKNISKDGENCELKDDPHCKDTVEDSSKVNHTDDDSTNKESDAVRNEHVGNETKHLLKVKSPDQAENANEGKDHTAQKSEVIGDGNCLEKDDGSNEKDLEAGSDLSDQPLSIVCDGPDSIKDDCITELNHQAPLTEQPSQADRKQNAYQDCNVLTDEHVSENAFLNKEPINKGTDTCSESDICLADKTQLKVKNNTTCLDVFTVGGSSPQRKDSLEPGSQAKLMANLKTDNEDQDIASVKGQQKADNTAHQEPFDHHAPVSQDEVIKNVEGEVAMTEETNVRCDGSNKGLWNHHGRVVIPFIGEDTSFEDIMESQLLDPKGKVEDDVQDKKIIASISKTTDTEVTLPAEVNSATQVNSEHAKLSAGKIPLLDVRETDEPVDCKESGSDDRCPTPTIDETPYPFTNSDSTDSFNSEVCKDITQKDHSRSSTPVMDETPLGHKSTLSDPICDGVKSDLELRTLRVLQSVDEFLSTLPYMDESSQIQTVDSKHSLDQTPSSDSKCTPTCLTPSHISADEKSHTKSAMVSASTSQELNTESSDVLTSSFKDKLEEVLGVKLQLKKINSTVCHASSFEQLQETSVQQDDSNRLFSSSEILQAIKTKSNVGHEPRSTSQHPIMAVKPSKSDESQVDFIPKDEPNEKSTSSKIAQTKISVVKGSTPRSIVSERRMASFKSDEKNDDYQEASELSFEESRGSNHRRFNLDKAKFPQHDSFNQHQHMDSPTFKTARSFSAQSFKPTKTVSKHVDGCQDLLTFVEKVGTTKDNLGMDRDSCVDTSSFVDYKTNRVTDNTLIPGTQTSLICTVYNPSVKRSYSFLEQLSSRCSEENLTQSSMDRECLIFSEQMKQLLKRRKKEPLHQQVPLDKSNLSCSGPVTVNFSSLEEQDDSVYDFEVLPSFAGQKIKVDMSDRKVLGDATQEEMTLQPQTKSCDTSNPRDHAVVSGMTEECTRLYEEMMNDVCSGKKVPSTPKDSQMDRGYAKTDPSSYFGFCSQMKKEMDESFRSHLNSVVKKSCKTKYRFFMLMTSDDAFFEETKVQLEAGGHTAVRPSQFFLDEDSSSTLLIIIRNEDIAEHICEVPHLLELKKSKGVQFAGIDEPDDVVNLTHQELFTRGGFVMFDGEALESLNLCNMKKLPDVLQELSQTGKWKWFLHYRDSRRLKENARLCAEAKEKKLFLNKCQEEGILELLPYHECDLMSRERPDYLTCLGRLQVQNISARYPVFVTDTTTDGTFGRSGILTMTVSSFLMNSVNMLT